MLCGVRRRGRVGVRSHSRALPAVLVAFLIAVGGSAAASTRAASATSFSDTVGDATGGAPDLRTIAVEDDATTGTITIEVSAAGYSSAPAELHPQIRVYLDTDRNASTGDPRNAGS